MASSVVPLTQYPQNENISPDAGEKYYHAIGLEMRTNDIAYVLSEPGATTNPADGLTILDCLISEKGLPVVTENAGFESGTATISGGTIKILDLGDSLADFMANKQVNNRAMMNSIARIYTWPEGSVLDLSTHCRYTFLVGDVKNLHGEFILPVTDINRNTQVKIFNPRSWRLNETLPAGNDVTLVTTLELGNTNYATETEFIAANDFRFQHTDSYIQDPGDLVRYFIIEGNDSENGKRIEVLSSVDRGTVNGFGKLQYQIKERALFQTKEYEWEVNGDTTDNNKTEVREFIYFEEDPSNSIAIAYNRETHDGRASPEHWGAGIESRWINFEALARYSTSEVRVTADPEEQAAKDYVEKEMLTISTSVFTINNRGQLTQTPMITEGDTGAEIVTFDETNTDLATVSEYTQETKNVKAYAGIEWGWNPILKRFERPVYWTDDQALDRNRSKGSILYSSKTLKTGRFTESSLTRMAKNVYNRHIDPTQRINFSPDFDLHWLPLGSRCRVNFPHVRDHITGTGQSKPIDREMTLIGKTVDLNQHTVKFNFQGYFDTANEAFGNAQPELTTAEIMRGGIDIKTVPGGFWSEATRTLFGSPQLSLRKKYYCTGGDLILGDTMTPVWQDVPGPGLKVWVEGQLFVAAQLDLTGLGTGTKGVGGTETSAPTRGRGNYFGRSTPGGTWRLTTDFISFDPATGTSTGFARRTAVSQLTRTGPTSGRVNVHRLTLSHDDGQLTGFPADPGGSGGGGSGVNVHEFPVSQPIPAGPPDFRFRQVHEDQFYDGNDGGDGGAGFEFVSRPGSDILASGRLISDGGDASPGTDTGSFAISTTGGGPGMPGVLSWVIDGRGTKPVITETNFHAHVGQSLSAGSRFPHADTQFTGAYTGAEGLRHSYYEPTRHRNLWKTAHVIDFVPPKETRQVKPEDDFALESLLNPDGNVRLIVLAAQPSSANNRDLWITPAELARDTKEPTVRRFDAATGQWNVVSYPDSITTVLVQVERTYGAGDGTTLHFTQDGSRPTDFDVNDLWLDELTDTLWRLGATRSEDTRVSREEFGYYTADSYLADGNFVKYMAGDDTLIFSEDRTLLPVSNFTPSPPGPGETNDEFISLKPWLGNYDEAGVIDWGVGTTGITANAGAATDDGVMYISQTFGGGMQPDNDIRQIWAYVSSPTPGLLKIQAAGDATPTGDPSRQAQKLISNTSLQWIKIDEGALGHFRAFSAQLQIRSQTLGMIVRRVVLLDINSTDTPAGSEGFTVPLGNTLVPRIAFAKQEPADRLNPTPWARVGATLGDGGSPAVEITAGGAGVHRYFAERFPFPIHAGRRYQVTMNVKGDSLVTSNSNNQGAAVSMKAYNAAAQVRLNNDVEVAGASHWNPCDKADFAYSSDVIEIPPNQNGMVYLTVQPTVHAVSGKVIFSDVKCKELTRSVRGNIQTNYNSFNPFGAPNGAGISTAIIFLLDEQWDVDEAPGKQLEAAGNVIIQPTTGSCWGTVIVDSDGPDGAGSAVIQSATQDFTALGQNVSFSGQQLLLRRTTAVRISLVLFASTGSVPQAIDVTGVNYQFAIDEALKEGW